MATEKAWAARRGKGKAYLWIVAHKDYQGDDCLPWPFHRLPTGRGMLGYRGKLHHASRLMCIVAHGEPPTPQHQAAHNCDNGHLACMNQKHLEWKTCSDNHLDRRRNGTTTTNRYGNAGALSRDEVVAIRTMKDRPTNTTLAKRYGVSMGTIRRVLSGETYRDVPLSSAEGYQNGRR